MMSAREPFRTTLRQGGSTWPAAIARRWTGRCTASRATTTCTTGRTTSAPPPWWRRTLRTTPTASPPSSHRRAACAIPSRRLVLITIDPTACSQLVIVVLLTNFISSGGGGRPPGGLRRGVQGLLRARGHPGERRSVLSMPTLAACDVLISAFSCLGITITYAPVIP